MRGRGSWEVAGREGRNEIAWGLDTQSGELRLWPHPLLPLTPTAPCQEQLGTTEQGHVQTGSALTQVTLPAVNGFEAVRLQVGRPGGGPCRGLWYITAFQKWLAGKGKPFKNSSFESKALERHKTAVSEQAPHT